MIHIINKLQLSNKGLIVKGTKQEVPLQQGTMDGACAVYSMMMCLIMIRAIHRNDVVSLNDERIKGNTAKGRLIRNFLYNNGFVRKGFFLSTLCEELSHSYSKVVQSEYYHLDKNENEFFSAIIKALENNIPVELGFIRKTTGGHAVIAIGFEENPKGFLLYIIDPGFSVPLGQYWNNVIQIEINCGRKYNAFNYRENCFIQIDEALIIKKK